MQTGAQAPEHALDLEWEVWDGNVWETQSSIPVVGAKAIAKAIAWVKPGAVAAFDGKVGIVTMHPDSDQEVKLRWAGTTETSSYVKADRVQQPSTQQQKRAVPW
eukprot:SAG11_NODE_2328_length_3514_cov_3.922694_3_plen_104_part_00